MPELPEVETVRVGLKRLIVGKKVASQSHDWPKSFPNSQGDVNQFLIGSKISDVRRRAKVLIIDLDTKYSLVIHLKMRLLPTIEIPNIDFMKKVGPEPLETEFTSDILHQRLQRRKNSSIKAALLDQTVLAGIGNIYADESLWGAKIHPETKVGQLTKPQTKKLYTEIVNVLRLSIEKGGSTDRNYVNAEGKKGSYIEFAKVFRRENLPCPRCSTTIIKTRVAGRGTHLCPKCQVVQND
ncbi:hypothetical protein HY004_00965 [Candidatus Saccharibacteria bacterium]|nr:hypothetical protein [Candidatus Saccharibacteria bacterium]